VDEFKANMLGWRTRTFANVNLVHHRPSGDAYGQWSNWRKNGFANYVAGYHPVFMLAKCVKRAFHRPFFLASAALLTGFCSGYLKRMPQVQEAEVIRYLRQQQLRRLLGRPSIYKSAPPPCVHTGLCSTSMSAVELSIIIVNWYSADYVLNCIRSIREQASVVSYEVIVVDNASFDGCRERLEREHPDVVFVQSQHNLGFARANNLGAGHARGTVLLFLNPDTEVRDRAIQRLYTSIRALPDAGVIGCRLLNTDGSVQTSCVQSLPTVLNQLLDAEVLRRWFPKAGLWGAAALYEGGTEPAEVQAVSGACMMIRRDVFDRIGGFSPDYFMYAEDLDLCFKTRRAGSRNYHLGDLVIVHHGGGSSQQARSDFSNVMVRDSVGRFLRKSRGGFYSGCYRLALTGAALIRLALLMVLFPAWLARRGVRGWGAACRKWFAIFRWGLGLTRWTREYEQLEPMGACPDGGVVKSCAGSAEN